jgi:hypothetical protein
VPGHGTISEHLDVGSLPALVKVGPLEVKHVDALATRGTQRLHAEAKGRTASVGLDVDTLYGQLLHRMPPEALGPAIFAGVAPASLVRSITPCFAAVHAAPRAETPDPGTREGIHDGAAPRLSTAGSQISCIPITRVCVGLTIAEFIPRLLSGFPLISGTRAG